MKKLFLSLGIFLLAASAVYAASSSSKSIIATVDVLDVNKATLSITYKSPSKSNISVLPTKKFGLLLDSGRTLVRAYGSDNTPRDIKEVEGKDAVVSVKKNDKEVTVVYELSNLFAHDTVSMFNFPVILGSAFPRSASVSVTSSNPAIDIFYYSHVGMGQSLGQVSFISNKKSSELYLENLTVIAYREDQFSGFLKQDLQGFSILSAKNKTDRISEVFSKVYQGIQSLEAIFGISRPQKIAIVSVPFKNLVTNGFYEASGIALSSDLIIVDSGSYGNFSNMLDMQKILAHELAHLFVDKSGIIMGDIANLKWLNEGLAVFGEQYLSDNFLNNAVNPIDLAKSSQDYKKLSKAELLAAYNSNFDFDFSINNQSQPISRTYKHAGMIFYNLYLKSNGSIKKILSSLKKTIAKPSCVSCDRQAVLKVISKTSGLSNDDIIYPYKKDPASIPTEISKNLFSQ